MIDVTHDSHYRRTWFEVLWVIIFLFFKQHLIFGRNKFYLEAEFAGYEFYDFSIKPLVDRNDDTSGR